MKTPCPYPRRQRGMTLLVGLVMLVLMTLVALAAMRMTTTHLQVIGNEQFHDEAEAAANFVLDQVATDSNFVTTYAQAAGQVFPSVSVGQSSYQVTVPKMTCKRFRAVKNSELVTRVGGQDTITAANQACIAGQGSTTTTIVGGIAGGGAGASLCATVLWDVEAQVGPDPVTGATADMHMGLELRDDATNASNYCK